MTILTMKVYRMAGRPHENPTRELKPCPSQCRSFFGSIKRSVMHFLQSRKPALPKLVCKVYALQRDKDRYNRSLSYFWRVLVLATALSPLPALLSLPCFSYSDLLGLSKFSLSILVINRKK